ncbi:MAG: UDP-N-acetylmuramate--L-alanine ligase [Candidatus Saccharimonadia bacterium]
MDAYKHIHILGIAGHAMRGLALALLENGAIVTGTDEHAYPPGTDWLKAKNILWWNEPSIEHLTGADLVILGGGVAPTNPELLEAQSSKIPIMSYPEVVGKLTSGAKRIVITGTHGKTTTTSLITWVLESAGLHPDYLIGILPNNFSTSVRLKGAHIAVLEGDEYRSSQLDPSSKFMYYHATEAIITSIELDHPDLFADLAAVKDRFSQLVENLPRNGRLFVCESSAEAISVASSSSAPITTYGFKGHWRAQNVSYLPEGIEFELIRHDATIGKLKVGLYGAHNVLNGLAAAAVAMNEGVSFAAVQQGFTSFLGASRRFEMISKPDSKLRVIDDYAHHPTEVVATIEAAKTHFKSRVIAIFRPHTYSRTKTLLNEYHEAFSGADLVFIAPIEGAREIGHELVSSEDVAAGAGEHVSAINDRAELIKLVTNSARAGDVILCMSVNGYENIAKDIALALE